jgi:hypothetical protein
MFLPGCVDAKNKLGVMASFGEAALATQNPCDYHSDQTAPMVDWNLYR